MGPILKSSVYTKSFKYVFILFIFESGVVPGDWRSAVIVPLYKCKRERSECKNYRCINLLSIVGKI